MKNIVRFVALAVIVAVGASILTPAAAAPGVNGGGNGGGDNVCQPQDQHLWPGSGVKTVTVEAPAHKVITGYCVKAGSANQGNGPEYVNGLNATEVTFSHSSGKDISHYVVFYDDIPFNHNWEYADPTCTSLFVDYPDNLPHPQNANHVNIRFVGNGQTFTLNWHTAGTWAPEATFVYADHPQWPAGLEIFTVQWVQVAESNYHWQGELECGDDPEPSGAINISVECDSAVEYTVVNDGNVALEAVYTVNGAFQGVTEVPAGAELDLVVAAGGLEAGDEIVVELIYDGDIITTDGVVYPEPCFVADPGAELTYATECDAGITFLWTNTGNVELTVKQYRDDALVVEAVQGPNAGGGWPIPDALIAAGQTARVELYYEDVLIATTGNVEYAGPCFVPAPAGTVQLGVECDSYIEGFVTNTGNVDLTYFGYTDGMTSSPINIAVGESFRFTWPTAVEGTVAKMELFYGDALLDSAEVVHPGECPQPEGDLAIECVVNTDYRVSGSVTATDAGLAWGLGNRAPFVRLDGGRIGADVTESFDGVYTLAPGSTVFLREQGAGQDWIASVTVPEGCPVAPSGDLSIECVVDDLYDVDAFIDGGSTGVNWLLRLRGGGGIVTQGFVPAFETETVTLTEAQFDEGLVLVLRAPQNGGKLDSVSVPAPCFAPVSDSSIVLDTGCDSDADATVSNYGETTLYANVYINDVLYFNVDSVIEPGQVAEFNIPALALEPGDEVKVTVWGPEGYERESIIEYPEACPTTTTVPPTTVPPTTVPPTTTVPVPECLGPGDEDPRPQPGPGEPALPAIPWCDNPDFTG